MEQRQEKNIQQNELAAVMNGKAAVMNRWVYSMECFTAPMAWGPPHDISCWQHLGRRRHNSISSALNGAISSIM